MTIVNRRPFDQDCLFHFEISSLIVHFPKNSIFPRQGMAKSILSVKLLLLDLRFSFYIFFDVYFQSA